MKRTVEELSSTLAGLIAQFQAAEGGSRPDQVDVVIQQDLVMVHLKSVLSPSERALAQTDEGQAILQRFNNRLYDSGSNPSVKEQIAQTLGREVVDVQTSLSPLTGSLVAVFPLGQTL